MSIHLESREFQETWITPQSHFMFSLVPKLPSTSVAHENAGQLFYCQAS